LKTASTIGPSSFSIAATVLAMRGSSVTSQGKALTLPGICAVSTMSVSIGSSSSAVTATA